MTKNVGLCQATIVITVVAFLQFIIQVGLLTRGVEYVVLSLTIDDTYYYLQTAWNTKNLGFVTFDGINTTNGVQLLWFVIIVFISMFVKTKTALLFATMAVSFAINALCYLLILKIGTILKRPNLAIFISILWLLQSLPFRIYSMGMENSLHALVLWGVIYQGTAFLIRVQNRENPNFLGLTIALILNAWTRLDSAVLSVVLYTFCLAMLAYTYRNNFRLFLEKHLKSIAVSSLLAGFGLVAQLSAFWFMANSFLPVSALVKTTGASLKFSTETVNKFIEIFILGMPAILQGRFPPLILTLLGILGILFIVIRTRLVRHRLSKELMAFLCLWSCLLVGLLLYQVYIAISGVEYRAYFIWYRSPSFIFWIITASLVCHFTFADSNLAERFFRVSKWAPIGFSLVILVISIYLFSRSVNFISDLYKVRYHVALWISKNSPAETIYAAWNTGQLGFFSNRTFINLDGVINSVDYYERVLQGPVSLMQYLFDNKVDYVVDYNSYSTIQHFPVVRTFPLDDGSGRSIRIWQVPAQSSIAR
jgi:hypothetical protein